MNVITSFIGEKLYPSLFDHIPEVFPDMDFKRVRGKWISAKKRDGSEPKTPKRDKSYISERFIGNVMEQGEDKPITIIDLYAEKNGFGSNPQGATLWEVITKLCSIANIDAPQVSEEWERKYQEEKTRQEKLIASYERQKKALFTPEGKDVLQYLTNVRKYTEEEVRLMGLGYISQAEGERLQKETGIGVHTFKIKDYPLSWGFYSKGRIHGFKFRSILPEEELKQRGISKYDNTHNLPKNTNPFGLTSRDHSRSKNRIIVVVEGELDALHCIVKGFPLQIIATTGNGLTPEAVSEIKKKGFRDVVLLLDNDPSGHKFVPTSIKNIEDAELNPFVSVLPEGMGHDPDEFFKFGHTVEELTNVVNIAKHARKYEYDLLISQYGNNPSELEYSELEERFIDLTSKINNKTQRHKIICDYCQRFGRGSVSTFEKAITEKANKATAEQEKAEKKKNVEEALKKALTDLQNGKTQEVETTLSGLYKDVKVLADRATYEKYLYSNSDEIFQSLRVRPKGLNSGFQIESESDGNKKYQELLFPEGVISLIGGSTNHGKSTVLKNIVINALNERDPRTNRPIEGTLLYFTFEENIEAVTRQFINAYANVNLNPEDPKSFRKSNIEIIEEVLSGNDANLVRKNTKRKEFFTKLREFKKILDQQRLKIIHLDSNFHNELSGVVRFLKEEFPEKVRAVFVDYVQCLSVDTNGKTIIRTEELKEIMTSLDREVQSLKIPFIMTAQLKRDVKNFEKLTNQDFDQSSWIEKTASEIILLWSNRFKCDGEVKDTRLRDGQGGVIGAKLTKSRRYEINSVMFLETDKNTGKIEQSNKVEIRKEKEHGFDIDKVLSDDLFENEFFNVEEGEPKKSSVRPTLTAPSFINATPSSTLPPLEQPTTTGNTSEPEEDPFAKQPGESEEPPF